MLFLYHYDQAIFVSSPIRNWLNNCFYIKNIFMPNQSNNNNQPGSGKTKADNYDKEKDTAQKESKQTASKKDNTSQQEQEILKKQKETD